MTAYGACAVGRLLTIHWGRVLRHAVLTVVFTTALIGGPAVFHSTFDNAYHKDRAIAGDATVTPCGSSDGPSRPASSHLLQGSTGLPCGTHPGPGSPPGRLSARWSAVYLCQCGGAVGGLNVEMAHLLAREFGVALEFVPVARGAQMAEQLQNSGYCDIVMAAVAITQ